MLGLRFKPTKKYPNVINLSFQNVNLWKSWWRYLVNCLAILHVTCLNIPLGSGCPIASMLNVVTEQPKQSLREKQEKAFQSGSKFQIEKETVLPRPLQRDAVKDVTPQRKVNPICFKCCHLPTRWSKRQNVVKGTWSKVEGWSFNEAK